MLQVQIDNDKCRRDREARLSGSRLEFCVPRGGSRDSCIVDNHGNTLTLLQQTRKNSTQRNNNLSPNEDEPKTLAASLTSSGKITRPSYFVPNERI